MKNPGGENLPKITADYLIADSVCMPETVFPLGTKFEYVSEKLKDLDKKRHLNIANMLDATPPYYVHLPQFWMGKKLVTNGQYRAFICATDSEGKRFYDAPDVWRYIWGDLNCRLESVKMPFRAPDGTTIEAEENYSDCESFVEAYLNSLKFEMERVILSREGVAEGAQAEESGELLVIKKSGSKTQHIEISRADVLSRFFALVKYRLRNSILGASGDVESLLCESEREVLGYYSELSKIERDANELISRLKSGYLQSIDKRFVQAFKRGQHRVETILFLERFKSEVAKAKDMEAPIPLGRVIYPRFWDTPDGSVSKDILKRSVDWADRPLDGITLYEAVAFVVWLSSITGLDVAIPSEAEYECSASWGAEQNISEKGKIVIDPRLKNVLPWENSNDKDFNYFFGQDGKEVDKHYVFNRVEYENLLEETARTVGSDKVYQMVGFGWQWTCDRYDDDERKYNRFESDEYAKFTKASCKLVDGTKLRVYEYEPNRNVRLAYIVLRGAPDIVGGPGLVTRRFCTYPLRGYPKVSFRWVIHGH
jgi:formylglycine-generating enzyme required for sulfatase activity